MKRRRSRYNDRYMKWRTEKNLKHVCRYTFKNHGNDNLRKGKKRKEMYVGRSIIKCYT